LVERIAARRNASKNALIFADQGVFCHLCGDLAGILALASDNKKPGAFVGAGSVGPAVQGTVVAGTGFEPVTFRL